MADVWSSGTWTVKAGREQDFVEGWREFATWGLEAYGPARAWLLRDREQPNRFVSIGPWPSDEIVAAWRADPAFRSRILALRAMLDDFQPQTLDPVVSLEDPSSSARRRGPSRAG